jgi:flagellar protein FlbD
MIALKRLNGSEFILNAGLIETVEATPDSIITLTNGKKIVVKNTVEEIVGKAVKYRQLCNSAVQVISRSARDDVVSDPLDPSAY